jgi:asparagine synthase (glutamine-hydrolysing)
MCGIAGWVDFSGRLSRDRAVVEAMTDTMVCRGPDDRGVWTDGPVALGHTRLAVIDVAGSRQPMVADGNGDGGGPVAVLSYNGEVYNFAELRDELRRLGHTFRTRGDTEVVLHAYLEWGEDCPAHLQGMFAFAIWDPRKKALLLARDHLGIKPLCYAMVGDGVVFASEPKAILTHPAVEPVVDADGLREVFSMARTPGGAVFRDIHELRPGSTLMVRPGRAEHRMYWSLAAHPHTASLDETVVRIRTMLSDIVAGQMVSDVPVALLLSGGLDSSALTALAAGARRRAAGDRVRSITLTYQGYSENFQPDLVRSAPDAPYAQAVADHVDADHLEVVLRPEELMDPQARLACLLAQDRPMPFGDMDTSAYLGFREVRKHASVALIGEVADEIFGGYSWIHISDLAEQPMYPWVSFEQWHPGTRDGLGRGLFDPGLMGKLDLDTFYADGYRQAITEVPTLDGESAQQRRAREICYLHLTRWLPMLLDRNDRLSMASGLELRVPFCDHRLVEYLFNVPWAMKTFDGREKSLLRAVAADLLPKHVLERPKSPFPVSQDPEYTRALHRQLTDTLADPNAPVAPFVDHAAAREMIAEADGEAQDWLFRMNAEMLLQFDAWLRHYRVQLAL